MQFFSTNFSFADKRAVVNVKKLTINSLTEKFIAKHKIAPGCISRLCLDLMDEFRIFSELTPENGKLKYSY